MFHIKNGWLIENVVTIFQFRSISLNKKATSIKKLAHFKEVSFLYKKYLKNWNI